MAKNGKKVVVGKAKPRKSHAVKTVQTKKRSASKAAKASNPCCPVIRLKCTTKEELLPKKDWKSAWSGGSEGSGDYTPVKTYAHVEKCSVMGSKPRYTYSEAKKRTDELAQAQRDKRCDPKLDETLG